MKPELLETLLLDRALGELSPEVSALLDAHLAQNPAAAARAAEFSATLMLARSAVATPQETPRPLDVARLRRTLRAGRTASRAFEILRLAACLALGLAVGWLARPAREFVAPTAAPVPVTFAPMPPPPRPADPATHFWSVARFAPESAQLHSPKNR